MKRILSLLLVMSLVFALFAACSQNEESTSTSEEATSTEESATEEAVVEEVKLTLGTNQSGAELELYQALAQKVESENPGLTIEITPYDSAVYRFEKLPAFMSSGTQPDIMVMFGGDDVKNYSQTGNLLDLTEFVNTTGLKDKFITLADGIYEDKLWRLPLTMYAEGFYYNKKILAELGGQVPTTYEEFIALCDQAKEKGYIAIGSAVKDGWATIMMGNTLWIRHAGLNATYDLGSSKLKWNDPKVVAAFKMYESFIQKGYTTPGANGLAYDQLAAGFLQGKTLFAFDGSWMAATYADPNSVIGGEVGFITFPKISNADPDQGSLNNANNFGYALSSKMSESQKKYAYKFLEAVFSDENAINHMVKLSSPFATKVDVTNVDGLSPIFKEILSVMNASTSQFEGYDHGLNPDIQTTLAEQLQKLYAGATSVEDMLNELQKTTDASLAK